jgi:hypothetical protein
VAALARALRFHARASADADRRAIELLYKSAPLHDIGKVGVPDRILLKPGKLDGRRIRDHEAAHRVRARRHRSVEHLLGGSNTSCASRARSPIRTRRTGTAPVIRRTWPATPFRCRRA